MAGRSVTTPNRKGPKLPATFSLTYTNTSGFDENVQGLLGPDYWAGSRLQGAVSFSF